MFCPPMALGVLEHFGIDVVVVVVAGTVVTGAVVTGAVVVVVGAVVVVAGTAGVVPQIGRVNVLVPLVTVL